MLITLPELLIGLFIGCLAFPISAGIDLWKRSRFVLRKRSLDEELEELLSQEK